MDHIEQACAHFRALLEEQLRRVENMRTDKVDFAKKEIITIGIIDGDGIGPIIMQQAVRVLEKLLAAPIAAGKVILKPIEGLTIENRLAQGKSVPGDVLAQIKSCDVLLKGPTTTPMGGTMESANVTLRRELDLYANVRPVSIPEQGIDWMFYRENTEGEYVLGSRGVELPGKLAVDLSGEHTAAEQAERVKKEVYYILNCLADYQYDPEEYAKRVRERKGWENLREGEESGE